MTESAQGPDGELHAGALLDRGLAHEDTVAPVLDAVGAAGRVIALRPAGGLHVDLLPDRGLDLGGAWWQGVPVAWRSPVLADPGPGAGWEERFLGGLLATCGPDNTGPPRGTSGQHGTHHLTPAVDVRWWRERTPAGVEVHVRGRVGHARLGGPWLVVEREVVVATGSPWVEVRDDVTNHGPDPVGVPLLYHVNLGAPLLRPGSQLLVGTDASPLHPDPQARTREPLPQGRAPGLLPEPAPGAPPVVAEHTLPAGGTGRVVLAGAGTRVVVEWPTATLPRLCTWTWPAEGAWVLGVEPTNAPLFGPGRDEPHAGAPLLAPGATWRTGVRVGVVPAPTEEDR